MSKRNFKPLVGDILEALADISSLPMNNLLNHSTMIVKLNSLYFGVLKSSVLWERIIRSRNIIAHEYEKIDFEIIWKIITIYLPPLKVTLERILKDIES